MIDIPDCFKPKPSTFSQTQAKELGINVEDYPYENMPKSLTSVWLTAGIWQMDGSLRCLLKTKDDVRFSARATFHDNFRLNSLNVPVMFLNPEDHFAFEPRLRFKPPENNRAS